MGGDEHPVHAGAAAKLDEALDAADKAARWPEGVAQERTNSRNHGLTGFCCPFLWSVSNPSRGPFQASRTRRTAGADKTPSETLQDRQSTIRTRAQTPMPNVNGELNAAGHLLLANALGLEEFEPVVVVPLLLELDKHRVLSLFDLALGG